MTTAYSESNINNQLISSSPSSSYCLFRCTNQDISRRPLSPSITLSVYNSKHQLVEKEKVLQLPVLIRTADQQQQQQQQQHASPPITATTSEEDTTVTSASHHNQHCRLVWGSTWHMETPLENLEPGSFIVVQVQLAGSLEADNSAKATQSSSSSYSLPSE
jgi:hypothetical protein